MKNRRFSTISDNSDHDSENSADKLGELLKKNRAAALGLAVMIATGAFFLGCSKAGKPKDRESLVDGIEDDDGYDFVGDSDGGDGGDGGGSDSHHGRRYGGYYHYAGAPMLMAGSRLMWGSRPHGPTSRGGYAISRGGRAGS